MVKMVGIFGRDWRQKSRHVSILEIFMHAKKSFWDEIQVLQGLRCQLLFLAWMKFTDGRFPVAVATS